MSRVRYSSVLAALGALVLGSTVARSADLTPAPAPAAPAPAPFFLFQDNTLSYRFEPTAKEPGVTLNGNLLGKAATIEKNIANLTHVDAWKYGTNFVTADFLFSDRNDPAAPQTLPGTGSGAMEIYALYRGTLSGNALSNTKTFAFGPIKDVSLGFGGDINTKNTLFAPRKRDLVIGPNFSFDTSGFFTFQVNLYKEWNHNAFGSPSKQADFNPVPEFELTYLQPLDKWIGLPLSFGGFTNVILPKGDGGTGAINKTKTEVLTSNRLSLDVSKYIGYKTHVVDVFVGYQYWYNKFGVDHTKIHGAIESSVFLGSTVHANFF